MSYPHPSSFLFYNSYAPSSTITPTAISLSPPPILSFTERTTAIHIFLTIFHYPLVPSFAPLSGLEPQTGIIVGITANSTGSHQVYYPSFNSQQGATILSRAATQLTVLPIPLHTWNLATRSPPPHQPLSSQFSPATHAIPINQPLLNPPSSSTPLPTLPTPLDSTILSLTPNLSHINTPSVSISDPLPVPTILQHPPTLPQSLSPTLLPIHDDVAGPRLDRRTKVEL